MSPPARKARCVSMLRKSWHALSTECRGFLLFLEQAQVLNAETREICIERLLELDKPDIELDDLKWVVMMVLFNVPGSENAYQQMEELVFDESDGVIH